MKIIFNLKIERDLEIWKNYIFQISVFLFSFYFNINTDINLMW